MQNGGEMVNRARCTENEMVGGSMETDHGRTKNGEHRRRLANEV